MATALSRPMTPTLVAARRACMCVHLLASLSETRTAMARRLEDWLYAIITAAGTTMYFVFLALFLWLMFYLASQPLP